MLLPTRNGGLFCGLTLFVYENSAKVLYDWLNAETNKAFIAHLICAKILRADLYILTNSIIFLFIYYICAYNLDFCSLYMLHITMLF